LTLAIVLGRFMNPLDSNSQNGSSLGSVRVHSFTFSYTLESMRCDFWASLLACTLASPCFGYKPKVKVVTICDHVFLLIN